MVSCFPTDGRTGQEKWPARRFSCPLRGGRGKVARVIAGHCPLWMVTRVRSDSWRCSCPSRGRCGPSSARSSGIAGTARICSRRWPWCSGASSTAMTQRRPFGAWARGVAAKTVLKSLRQATTGADGAVAGSDRRRWRWRSIRLAFDETERAAVATGGRPAPLRRALAGQGRGRWSACAIRSRSRWTRSRPRSAARPKRCRRRSVRLRESTAEMRRATFEGGMSERARTRHGDDPRRSDPAVSGRRGE